MEAFDDVSVDTLLHGDAEWIGSGIQDALAEGPLDCVETEYPHYQQAVESAEIVPPRERHPVFFGCFDWHSAVHSHWSLVRQLRLFDDHPRRGEIVRSIDARLTEENVRGEVEYLKANPSFENPYGWGWLLRLAAELALWDDEPAPRWRETLAPLESRIASLVTDEFLTQDRPFRVGTHGNTAYSLAAVLDYAAVVDDESLWTEAETASRRFFGDDRSYPVAYEPLGWDFISPGLTEADLMRRVLDRQHFGEWLDQFLPDVTRSPHASILEPISVDPETESGMELHYAGLNLSKAWCLVGLAAAAPNHRFADRFGESARRHAEAGVAAAFTDAYAGSHWLGSYLLYLLTRNEGGIAH